MDTMVPAARLNSRLCDSAPGEVTASRHRRPPPGSGDQAPAPTMSRSTKPCAPGPPGPRPGLRSSGGLPPRAPPAPPKLHRDADGPPRLGALSHTSTPRLAQHPPPSHAVTIDLCRFGARAGGRSHASAQGCTYHRRWPADCRSATPGARLLAVRRGSGPGQTKHLRALGGAPQARMRARRAGAAVARRGWSRWAAARRWPAAQSPPAAGRARPRAGSRTAVAPAPPWPRTPLPAHELWQHARRICSPPALTACTQRRSGCSRRLESVQSRWTAQVLNSATLGAYRARMRPASAGLSWMCVCAASQASLRPESLRRVCHLPRRELGAPTLAQHLQKPCASAACLAAVGVLLARSSHLAAVVDGDVHRSSSSGRLA